MQFEVGQILSGKVTGITKYGVFVELKPGTTGMVHISEVASVYVKEIRDYVTDNQEVEVKIIAISDDGKISLSMKQAAEQSAVHKRPAAVRQNRQPDSQHSNKKPEPSSFDDMLSKFMQTSDDKLSRLKKSGNERRSSRRSSGNRYYDE